MRLPVLAKKPLRDLSSFRTSCALLFLAMSTAVAAATAFVVAWSVLDRETERSFIDTRPVHVEVILDKSMSSDRALDWIARLSAAATPGSDLELEAAEPARRIVGRIETSQGFWKTLILFVRQQAAFDSVPEASGLAMLRSAPADTARGTSEGLFIERSAVRVLQPELGASGAVDSQVGHRVRLPGDGAARPAVFFEGELYDGSQAPGWMENRVYGYVADSSLPSIGLGSQQATPWDRIWLRFANSGSRSQLRQRTLDLLSTAPAPQGLGEPQLWIPIPDTHPHDGQMRALLWTVLALGLLVLLLTLVSSVTLIGGLLARQRSTLGIVKALGGSRLQSFLALAPMVLLPALAALVPGALVGLFLGRAYSRFAADMLNVSIASWRLEAIPMLTAGLALICALTVAVVVPFARAARRPAREYLAQEPAPTLGSSTALSSFLLFLGRALPTRLASRASLLYVTRNLNRQRRRTLFTLATLAIAGTVFLVSANLGQAWLGLLADEIEGHRYDAELTFRQPVRVERLETALEIPGEAAGLAYTFGLRSNESMVVDPSTREAERISLLELDPSAGALEPRATVGRWLSPDGTGPSPANDRQLVLNRRLAEQLAIEVGDEVRIDQQPFRVVGLVEEVWAAAHAYTSFRSSEDLQADRMFVARDGFSARSFKGQPTSDSERRNHALLAEVEDRLGQYGGTGGPDAAAAPIAVAATRTRFEHYKGLYDHVVIFLRTFQAICLLLATLALFALASMLALSVLERARELGVLRVLGATPRRMFGLILVEGLLVVLLGCALATALSIPISLLLGDQSGRMFVGTPLAPSFSLGGYLSWLFVLLLFGAVACWLPGRRAAQQRIRQLL